MRARSIASIASIAFSIIHILGSLIAVFLILNWNVWRARGAFEKQLVLQGMRKEDARKVGARYSKLKGDILGTMGAMRIGNKQKT